MKKFHFLLVIILGFSFTACGSPLFHANFGSSLFPNRINPIMLPVGEPVGDVMLAPLNTPFSDVDPPPVTIIGRAENKFLVIINREWPWNDRHLSFISRYATPDSQEYWAVWTGHALVGAQGSAFDIFLSGQNRFSPMASLRIKNDQIFLRVEHEGISSYELLGPLPRRLHTIVMKIDKNTRQYSVNVFPTASRSLSTGVRSVLHQTPLNSNRPTLYMGFSEDAVDTTNKYFLKEVLLTESCPHEVESRDGETVTKYNCL